MKQTTANEWKVEMNIDDTENYFSKTEKCIAKNKRLKQ